MRLLDIVGEPMLAAAQQGEVPGLHLGDDRDSPRVGPDEADEGQSPTVVWMERVFVQVPDVVVLHRQIPPEAPRSPS